MDDSECTFCSEQTEYADFFTKDQTVEMKISGISGSYSVIPYQMDNWNEKMQFTFCDESDKHNFSHPHYELHQPAMSVHFYVLLI